MTDLQGIRTIMTTIIERRLRHAALTGLGMLLIGLTSGCSAGGYTFFGVATIDPAGTLCLQMRTEEPGRPVAEGYFCYPKSDPEYRKIKDHVGPIQVGESKVIKPFDE